MNNYINTLSVNALFFVVSSETILSLKKRISCKEAIEVKYQCPMFNSKELNDFQTMDESDYRMKINFFW